MARAKRKNPFSDEEIGGIGDELDIEEEEMEAEVEHMKPGASHARHRAGLMAFDAFDILGGPMARVMDQNRMIFQRMIHAMQEESLRFVNRRLEHTSHAIESSRECHGVSGLMAVQHEWILDFARDYAEQTKRFAELMRELAEDGTATLSEASSSVMERGRAEMEAHRRAAE